MTPLVRELSALVPEPETAYWFDLGTFASAVQAQLVQWDDVRHLPYPRTVAVFVTDKGARCAVWMKGGEHSITMAYLMQDPGKRARFSAPIAVTDDGGAPRFVAANGGDGQVAARVLVSVMQRLHSQHTAYRPERAGTPTQQRKRQANGKRPMFVWRTVTIGATPNVAVATSDVAGTHASPRAHDRRGHWRTYRATGKRVWVKHCRVGNATDGVVFKDYKLQDQP